MTVDLKQLSDSPWRWRAPAMSVYALALIGWIVLVGVPTDPFQAFAWLWLATIGWDIRAPRHSHLRFARDWGPVFAALVVYLYSRGLSDNFLPVSVHWTFPIRVDEWLGRGELPTERLQSAWCHQPCAASSDPRWYDAVLTTIYFSHFVVGLTIAVVLWLRSRAAWVHWMRRYLVINFAALAVYIMFPMAPPWLASKEGYTSEHIVRLTGRGWNDLGLGGFHVLLAKVGNQVAAMPSLHGGLAMLVAVYGITRMRSAWRWLLLAYPALMAVALVYYGEHYFIDLVAGWGLAALVMLGCGWWESWHRDVTESMPKAASGSTTSPR